MRNMRVARMGAEKVGSMRGSKRKEAFERVRERRSSKKRNKREKMRKKESERANSIYFLRDKQFGNT